MSATKNGLSRENFSVRKILVNMKEMKVKVFFNFNQFIYQTIKLIKNYIDKGYNQNRLNELEK